MEENGFVDQFMKSNAEPVEKFELVTEDIPNLVDTEMDIGFHDLLVGSDMEIVEHLVMDDLVVVGGDLYVAKHLLVSNETANVVSFSYVSEECDRDKTIP